ncbi:sensor histidine kinase [Paenibacillus camelliae]|uniref:sensor histidine kinase n=1 Tax=Paenibacillus camelliae TaxID=512410 RepID=UPI002040B39F|nr:GHKL domain-containing protein [Paenibacillus camelliae]
MSVFINISLQTITLIISIYILFQYEMSKKLLISLLIGSIILGYPLFLWQGIIGVFIMLLIWVVSLGFFRKKLFPSIVVPVVAVINLVISDYIVRAVFLMIKQPSIDYLQSDSYISMINIIICIVTLLLSFIVSYFLANFLKQDSFMRSYSMLFAILSIVTLVIFYINILIGKQSGFSDENIRANSVLFIFYFSILIGVCFLLTRMIVKETNMRNQQIQYERLTEYTENLEQMYTNMQKFRHDYINILLSMSEYIRAKNIEELEQYFNNNIMPISMNMKSNAYKLGSLHNLKIQELKGIISSKIIKAQELNIDANVEVVEPVEQINMDPVNLCRCVGIILDNAIEEAIHCEKPFVHVALIKRGGSNIIVVSNSSRPSTPELHKIYEKGFSTKGENRGLGLNNLREMVASCNNVTMDTQILHGKFTQVLDIAD